MKSNFEEEHFKIVAKPEQYVYFWYGSEINAPKIDLIKLNMKNHNRYLPQ
jgi:hypothetical protein